MSCADQTAEILGLQHVSTSEIEELSTLFLCGCQPDAYPLILSQLQCMERCVGFLQTHMRDHLQESVSLAAAKCALLYTRNYIEEGFSLPHKVCFVIPFCQFRPEYVRSPISKKLQLASLSKAELQTTRTAFQEAMQLCESNVELVKAAPWQRLLAPWMVLAKDWLPHLG